MQTLHGAVTLPQRLIGACDMKKIIPRSFTFDVMIRETADGRVTKSSTGGPWLRLARKMAKNGRAKLTCNGSQFAGYGGSYDVGYHRVNYTVTEIV
jgi:hypothetical protein